jgi:hypothetical protein
MRTGASLHHLRLNGGFWACAKPAHEACGPGHPRFPLGWGHTRARGILRRLPELRPERAFLCQLKIEPRRAPLIPRHPTLGAEAQVENPHRLNALTLTAPECFFVAGNSPTSISVGRALPATYQKWPGARAWSHFTRQAHAGRCCSGISWAIASMAVWERHARIIFSSPAIYSA